MDNLQAGYTPKPDLNNQPNLAPEDRAALEAFRAGLQDAVTSDIINTKIGPFAFSRRLPANLGPRNGWLARAHY